MKNKDNHKAKDRIINAATKLFSRKGFSATSVNEIAKEAKVTKALIYYYFKSKKDVLDCLVSSLSKNTNSATIDFIHASIDGLIKEGRLDVLPDRLRFTDDEAVDFFLRKADKYYRQVLDYVLENRRIIRIFLLESLSGGRYHREMLRLMNFGHEDSESLVGKNFANGKDFNYSDEMTIFKFFFSTVPLFTFAAYYDDLEKISALNAKKLRHAFLNSLQMLTASLVCGRDILLQNKQLQKNIIM